MKLTIKVIVRCCEGEQQDSGGGENIHMGSIDNFETVVSVSS